MYNDADILEKILKDKRKELGPPEEDDMGSPKLKLSKFDHIGVVACSVLCLVTSDLSSSISTNLAYPNLPSTQYNGNCENIG